MKTRLLFGLIAGTLLCGCVVGSSLFFHESAAEGKPNLLKNNDFERASDNASGLPVGWFLVSTGDDQDMPVSSDSLAAFSGKKSVCIRNSNRNIYLVSDAFKVNYTAGYYTVARFMADKKMRKPAVLYFWGYDDTGRKRDSFRKSIKANTDWKKAVISAGFLRNTVTFARIAIFIPKDPGNVIRIDDAGCYQVHQFPRE